MWKMQEFGEWEMKRPELTDERRGWVLELAFGFGEDDCGFV
jgi:hypothetical protein